MFIGYIRVSTADQDTQAQIRALNAQGCEKIFQEEASAGRWDRPELHRLIEGLHAHDVVVVWKLDQLSRSLTDLLHILERIEGTGARFQSISEAIDTTTPAGRILMQMVGSFTEFERVSLRERTQAGMIEARKAGRIGGRRPKLSSEQQREVIRLIESGEKNGVQIARLFGVHPATVTRIMAKQRTTTIPPPAPMADTPKTATKKHSSKKKVESSKAQLKRKTPTKAKSPAKGMPKDWTLDALNLARPPEFHDFSGAVQVQQHEESKTGSWNNKFKQTAMAIWEAETLLADFYTRHADSTITTNYPYPDKTILQIRATYEDDAPDYRIVLSARSR